MRSRPARPMQKLPGCPAAARAAPAAVASAFATTSARRTGQKERTGQDADGNAMFGRESRRRSKGRNRAGEILISRARRPLRTTARTRSEACCRADEAQAPLAVVFSHLRWTVTKSEPVDDRSTGGGPTDGIYGEADDQNAILHRGTDDRAKIDGLSASGSRRGWRRQIAGRRGRSIQHGHLPAFCRRRNRDVPAGIRQGVEAERVAALAALRTKTQPHSFPSRRQQLEVDGSYVWTWQP